MRYPLRIVFGHLLVASALSAAPATWADVVSVSPSTGAANVALGQPVSVTVVWSVMRQVVRTGGCGPTVSSGSGTLRAGNAGGPVLRVIPATLTQTQPCPTAPGTVTPFTFTETMVIPADVARRAQRLGHANVVYVRAFNDTQGASSGEAALSIVGSAVAEFFITRLALSFDNDAAARVVARREPLAAVAEIGFNGTGFVQAQWEIAGPESTAGTPIFRPVGQVRQYLTGGRTQVLRSPVLPTTNLGLYLARLRVIDPAITFEPPVIRYFVTQRVDEEAAAPPVALRAPPPRTLLTPDTTFVWEAIRAARAYQLEIYSAGEASTVVLPALTDDARGGITRALSQPPVTGVLVPGSQPRTVLSAVVRRHLVPGRTYAWRVLAIGADGGVIGASPVRELRMP